MRVAPTAVRRLALVLAHASIVLVPRITTAIDPAAYCAYTPLLPKAGACERWVCIEADRTWETRPLSYGTHCGVDDMGFCDGVHDYCIEPVRGTAKPLYMFLGVRYMPPGVNSTVVYGKTETTATVTSISRNFTSSSSTGGGLEFDFGVVSAGGNVSVGDSTTDGSTETASISASYTETQTLSCRPPDCGGDFIDHRHDWIVILTDPRVNFAVFPEGVTPPPGHPLGRWSLDLSSAEEWSLKVGWLNGSVGWPEGLDAYLEYYYGIGPAEYPGLLSASNFGYSDAALAMGSWMPDPDRYQLYDANGIQLTPGYPGTTGIALNNAQSDGITREHSTSHTVSASVEAGGGFDLFGVGVSAGLTSSWSWTWTYSTSYSFTRTESEQQSVTLNSPQYGYPGPFRVYVYIDKLYQTFMFSYCKDTVLPWAGCAAGPPAPGAASSITAVASQNQSSVAVSWAPPVGATGYTLWRSNSPESGFAPVAPSLDGFQFADRSATNRTTPYYYKVTAFNDTGTGPESPLGIVPAAPAGLTPYASGPTVYLSWQPSAAATSYSVWRSVDNNRAWSPISAAVGLASTSFAEPIPPPGTRHYYVVNASSASGSSSFSNEASILSAPAAPTGVTAIAGDRSITVRWEAPKGTASYTVQRSADALTWTPIANGVTTLYFANSGLTNGVRYYYRVFAVNAGGTGPASAVVSAVPTAPYVPPPPAGCGDGVCNRTAGETCASCPRDCGCSYSRVCKCGGVCMSASQQCW